MPSLDCWMRHEVPNLQSIYLLKMYRNPFTHFLIAGEAHAKCRCCAILAIPSMTILIAEDEARSAELVQAILLSYLFSCILLNLSAFPTSFLPIGGSTPSCNFLFSFLIYYSNLGYYQFYILFFAPAFLEPFPV